MHAMPAPAGSGSGWPRDEPARPCRRYVPREREEYAARRALFLQTYRFTTRGEEEEEEEEEGLRGRVMRRLRVARESGRGAVARARWWLGAVLARAWRARRHPAPKPSRKYYYLHGFA